jgi:tetratricopeptide (TPR) repeat protein
MLKKYFLFFIFSIIFTSIFSQANHVNIDEEKQYKDAKELFVKEQYALAYPLLKELKEMYSENSISNHTYINDDVRYFFTVTQLKLNYSVAEEEAKEYIDVVSNEPRRELMSYHLAKYYFTKEAYTKALFYYERAGLDNLSNDEIADAKFERAYCYFSLKQFDKAKPLFNEIHQLPKNKYYIPANYYFGFISYSDKQYSQALQCFKLVEPFEEYKNIVPYYIAEIYYFQGKKDEALKYGENILAKGGNLFYEKEMKLLIGQLYFEKQAFSKALPLLEYYVSKSDKIDKEVLYELSYCYYQNKQLTKAIDGFKQLSNERDSMGQNSMYLLGDCYLRTNQKANARSAFQFCAYNNSNAKQQEVSRFIYSKLSYELGYQDVALNELKKFLSDYPNSTYEIEAKEILIGLLANTNNYTDALNIYESFGKPTIAMQKVYPRILYGRAMEYLNDQQILRADELLTKIQTDPNAAPILLFIHFWKGEIALRTQKYDEAIKYFTLYLQSSAPSQGEANPSSARYNLGYSWFKKENYKQAINYFEQVATNVTVTSTTTEQDAFVRTADCYFMSKDFAKANNLYSAVINNALPQSDYAMFQKALIGGVKSAADKINILNNLTKQYPQSSLVPDVNMEIANTYIADEKFSAAIPYLNTVLNDANVGGLKPKVYLKLGLCYYNTDKNKIALENYQMLLQKYPQSAEADEALDNIKNIYIEEGRPNDYVELMRKNGKNVSVSEADSLTYTAAEIKYNANDCAAAINGFNNYLSQYAGGAYVVDANFFKSECYNKNKDWANALSGYNNVFNKGLNKYYEKATLAAARITYFETKDYAAAQKYFEALRLEAVNQDNQLEALRGLVRCFYQLKNYTQANVAAKELLTKKGISTDDKAISFLVLGKSQQTNNDCATAIASYKSCAAINKSAWGAEARYELANCQFTGGNLATAEKSALAVIKETGSYDLWITKAYILLGDIFMQQKDFFNAKATYESVAKNSTITELKNEAQQKLDKAIATEKTGSKISGN